MVCQPITPVLVGDWHKYFFIPVLCQFGYDGMKQTALPHAQWHDHNVFLALRERGGTGMKNQVLVGIGYLKKIKYRSSRVRVHLKLYQKTLASLAK